MKQKVEKGNKGSRGEFERGALQGIVDELDRKWYSRNGYQGIFWAGEIRKHTKDGRYKTLMGEWDHERRRYILKEV